MGMWNKDGTMRPIKDTIEEARARLKKERRDKDADPTLRQFATRVPANVLDKFNLALAESGEKIQTVVRNWMIEYYDKWGKGK